MTVKPHDVGWSGECAEHQYDPAVVSEVRVGFGTAAGVVEVGHPMLVEDGEAALESLWRKVDMPIGRTRHRGDEEHRLRKDEIS